MEGDERKILMIDAATRALNYLKKKPEAIPEEIIKQIMKTFEAERDSKVLVIAAVNEAIKLRQKEKKLSDKQIVQKIMDKSNEIIMKSEGNV